MNGHHVDRFWVWGRFAWWRGLRDEIRVATGRVKSATTDDERTDAQAQLDELQRQEADAKQNGHRWLH